MKKFVKMSLVAALAITGTVASAQPLAEAIQNVDVSGTVVYRYDDRGIDTVGALDNQTNQYKVGVSLSSKVNDDVKFNSRFVVNQGWAVLNTSTTADATLPVNLSEANFAYTGIANTTVKVGKQGLATPWTNAIDSDGSEQTGTGILAATTMGPVTAAAGYFNQTNIAAPIGSFAAGVENTVNGSRDLIVAGLMGKFAMVNLEAWYLDIDEALDSVYVGANTSFDVDAVKIGLDAKYTTMDKEAAAANADDFGNLEVGITAKMGIFNAGVAYAETEKNGSGILNALAKNGQIGYSVNISGTTDADMMMYDLGAQVTPELHVGLNYDVVSDNTTGSKADDQSEAYVQVTYKMSKNLMTYVRLADGEARNAADTADVDYSRGRLQVQYSF